MNDSAQVLLKRVFGYDAFRPLQQDIINATLEGRDVIAILPTGAGKSLCFQLPALLRSGLTLVVSPLIALMKDQVDALVATGVAATLLNSSVDNDEVARRREGLGRREYKLLYVAPERVMAPGFLRDLGAWGLGAIAIDEAHCISEWGHDFRPEYRQLAELRRAFPGVPCLALTATATAQVRADIRRQLMFQQPAEFLASFNRPNLTYHVQPRKKVVVQVHDFVTRRPAESGIVYAGSRKGAESLAAALAAEGIRAVAYHAGLGQEERAANQEAFLRDEAQVVCATIAFGMGINKPDVRWVIHADLPKNIEGYYQETGRAGRDGLPADCVMFYSRGDLVKNLAFLRGHQDEAAAELAARQMRQMADFAEATECRRAALMRYFGEDWPETNCGGCDVCQLPRSEWDATEHAQKLLSCVFRIRQKSGFATGLKHVVEVLAGADTEKIRRFEHHTLSTWGIGKDTARDVWMTIGRQLVQKGFLANESEGFETVSLTASGREVLVNRTPVMLSKALGVMTQAGAAQGERAGTIACDEGLFAELRTLRKNLADARGVPPYIIFGDAPLRHMARTYPLDDAAFLAVPGVGRQKLSDYGKLFIGAIKAWAGTMPRLSFDNDLPAPKAPPKLKAELAGGASALESARLFREGLDAEAIAVKRGMALSTIHQHLSGAIASGFLEADPRAFYGADDEAAMRAAAAEHGLAGLAPLHEALGQRVDYVTLRYFRAFETRNSEPD